MKGKRGTKHYYAIVWEAGKGRGQVQVHRFDGATERDLFVHRARGTAGAPNVPGWADPMSGNAPLAARARREEKRGTQWPMHFPCWWAPGVRAADRPPGDLDGQREPKPAGVGSDDLMVLAIGLAHLVSEVRRGLEAPPPTWSTPQEIRAILGAWKATGKSMMTEAAGETARAPRQTEIPIGPGKRPSPGADRRYCYGVEYESVGDSGGSWTPSTGIIPDPPPRGSAVLMSVYRFTSAAARRVWLGGDLGRRRKASAGEKRIREACRILRGSAGDWPYHCSTDGKEPWNE